MIRGNRGVTLIEILAASLIGATLVGGVMVAFMLSVKITRESIEMADATDYVVQAVEQLRTRIACDDSWFDANCNLIQQSAAIPITLPDYSSLIPMSPVRFYIISPGDCDGVGGAGDCVVARIRLDWNQAS